MDNPATLENVEDAIERPLTPDEKRVIPNWLNRAWRELNRVVPAIETRVALPASDGRRLAVEDVTDVLVAMVERKVRNPDGRSEWRGDDYSEKVDASLSSGRIYVTAAEIASLMPAAPSFGQGIYSLPLGR